MRNGQIAQLQELNKCYLPHHIKIWVVAFLTMSKWDDMQELTGTEKGWLRKWAHLYRHQIAAMKRNRK